MAIKDNLPDQGQFILTSENKLGRIWRTGLSPCVKDSALFLCPSAQPSKDLVASPPRLFMYPVLLFWPRNADS